MLSAAQTSLVFVACIASRPIRSAVGACHGATWRRRVRTICSAPTARASRTGRARRRRMTPLSQARYAKCDRLAQGRRRCVTTTAQQRPRQIRTRARAPARAVQRRRLCHTCRRRTNIGRRPSTRRRSTRRRRHQRTSVDRAGSQTVRGDHTPTGLRILKAMTARIVHRTCTATTGLRMQIAALLLQAGHRMQKVLLSQTGRRMQTALLSQRDNRMQMALRSNAHAPTGHRMQKGRHAPTGHRTRPALLLQRDRRMQMALRSNARKVRHAPTGGHPMRKALPLPTGGLPMRTARTTMRTRRTAVRPLTTCRFILSHAVPMPRGRRTWPRCSFACASGARSTPGTSF